MKRLSKLFALMLVITIVLTSTAFAGGLVRDVAGKENKGIIVTYDGVVQQLKDGVGNPVYPVVINGSTYLPVRAVASMMQVGITWNAASQTIAISSDSSEGSVPTDLPAADTGSTPSVPEATGWTGSGTESNPYGVGQSFVLNYSGEFYANDTLTMTDLITINSVTEVSAANVLSYKMTYQPEFTYLKINLTEKMTNISYVNSSNPAKSVYLSLLGVKIYGTESATQTTSGQSYRGFETSMDTAKTNAVKYTQVNSGATSAGYTVTGDVIVGIKKGDTNVRLILYLCDFSENSANIKIK